MRLLLIGCSGFIGRKLVPTLLKDGEELTIISRKNKKNLISFLDSDDFTHLKINPALPSSWKNTVLLETLAKTDGVINLAGEPISEKRWTANHCLEIENSRIQTTNLLIKALHQLKKPPKVLINGSAIGFYGSSSEQVFDEEDSSSKDFLGALCQEWESAALKKPRSTRLIILRIGIVLGPDGGALGKMLPVFKSGLGGPIGDGNQWMSWIHRQDLCEIIQNGLKKSSWEGQFNCVAPFPIRMKEFSATLGKCLGRPSLIRVPAPLLKLLLGDGAKVVLEGQRVNCSKLIKKGFKFNYPKINQALMNATDKDLFKS